MDAALSTTLNPCHSVKNAENSYEETVYDLKKDFFYSKLRLCLYEDSQTKDNLRNKTSCRENHDVNDKINVEPGQNVQTFPNELAFKSELPQRLQSGMAKSQCLLKENKKGMSIQKQILSSSPSPLELDLKRLKSVNENLRESNEYFIRVLATKEKIIELLSAQNEELSTKNKALLKKSEKNSLDIRLLHKYCKDLYPVVQRNILDSKPNKTAKINVKTMSDSKTKSCLLLDLGSDCIKELTKLVRINKLSEKLEQRLLICHPKSKPEQYEDYYKNYKQSFFSPVKGKSKSRDDLDLILDIVKENESLKLDIAKKSKIIDELCSESWNCQKKSVQLQNEV